MSERRSRFAAICALSAVIALLLALGAPVAADPDKDESGKGEQHESEAKEKEKGSDEGGGNGDEGGGNGGPGNGTQGNTNDGQSHASGGSDGGGGGDSSQTRRSRQSGSTRQSSQSQPQGTTSNQQGNISCTELLGSGFLELKLQNPSSGTYSDGTLTITFQRTGEGTFSWSSNIDVDAVIAKGGEDSNIYRYPGVSDGFSGSASTPINPSNNRPYGLSHVSFCYDVGGTTTTTPPGPPTTPPPGPPTTPPPGPPGSPLPPDENVDVPDDDDVLGEIIENDDDDDVAGADEDVDASGTRPGTTGQGELPFTGASVLAIALLGLVVAGSGIVLLRRSREQR